MQRVLLIVLVLLAVGLLAACADDKAVTAQGFGPAPECLDAVTGDLCGGGIVVATDWQGTGESLVAADADEAPQLWADATFATISEPSANFQYDGRLNTSVSASGHPAGEACALSTRNGYTDWYLPAQFEFAPLNAMAATLGLTTQYWTSTQFSATDAFYWTVGSSFTNGAKTWTYNIRCIRRPF